MRKKLLWVVLTPVLAGLWGILRIDKTYAAVLSAESLYKLSIMTGVTDCYGLYAKDEVRLSDFTDYTSVFNTEGKWGNITSDDIWITTHVGNTLHSSDEADSNLSCKQVFEGYDGLSGQANGLKDYSSFPTEIKDYGYQFDHNEGETDANSGTANADTDQITITLNSISDASGMNLGNPITTSGGIVCNGAQKQNSKVLGIFGDTNWRWDITDCSGTITATYSDGNTILSIGASGTSILQVSSSYSFNRGYNATEIRDDLDIHLNELYQDPNRLSFKTAFEQSTFAERLAYYYRYAAFEVYGDPSVSISYNVTTPKSTDTGNSNSIYVPVFSKRSAGNIMLYNIGFDESLPSTGETQTGDYRYKIYGWNPSAKYSLYFHYLNNMIGEYPDININDCSSEKPTSGYAFRNSPTQWCRINIPPSAQEALHRTVSVAKSSIRLEKGEFQDVLDWFGNQSSYENMPENAYANGVIDESGEVQPYTDDEESSSELLTDPCYNAGLESMAWILCPTLNNSKNTVTLIDNLIEDWLAVDTSIYSMEDESGNSTGIYIAWDYMRGIANVAIIILLLVIIYSQLTGVGIDNYGIKKMLPKLVVVAVLINLSFLICELAIDLSNILGSGLNQMFRAIGQAIVASADESLLEGFVGHVITTLFAAVGVAGAVAPLAVSIIGVAGAEGGGVMIVVLIVLALLVVLAAVLLFFVMLGARMIIVILCAALSPLAFICYVMPNTNGYFRKWWELFKSALIMFPICGAIGGIGYMIKAIVLTTSGVHLWMMVFAILVPYLPMFLLPTLLKNTIASVGKLGGTLSNLGNHFKGGAKGIGDVIQNTDRYKDRLQFAKDSAAATRAQRIHDRLSNRAGLTRSQQDRLRRADDIILAQRKRQRENALRTEGTAYFDAMGAKQDLELESETTAIEQYNDGNYVSARTQGIADEARRQRSKDRTTLAMHDYQGHSLQQLQAEWDTAFRTGNTDQLDALTNVMTQRYGTSAASSIGQSLASMRGIGANNEQGERYRTSLRQLQQTMNDNSAFSGHMKNKASDAFQMISEAGAHYDSATGTTTYEDLSYFSQNNSTSSDIKDWSTQSGATLQRAIDSGALSTEMVRQIMSSTDPAIQSSIQSDPKKRDILQAHLYDATHNPSGMGPALDVRIAAERYRTEQAAQQQAAAQAAQKQFDSITRNLDEINQQLHQHGS